MELDLIFLDICAVLAIGVVVLRLLVRSLNAVSAGACQFRAAGGSGPGLSKASWQRRGLLITGVLLLALICVVKFQGEGLWIDELVNQWLVPLRSRALVHFFYGIAALGQWGTVTVIVLMASVLLLALSRSDIVLSLWVAFAGAQATSWSLKYLVNRPRPPSLPRLMEHPPSFPCDHATTATVMFGFIALVACRLIVVRSLRVEICLWSLLTLLAICFSRLYLSVQYFTDVLGGWLIGGFWILAGAWVLDHLDATGRRER